MIKEKHKPNKIVLFFLLAILVIPLFIFNSSKAYNDFAFSEDESYSWLEDCDDVSLVRFNEFGYENGGYYLELYLYNPKNRDIDFIDKRNKVQMAYTGTAEDVLKVNYNKYRISYVDSTENDLFIRVQIAGFDKPKDECRYYCISGIELVSRGDATATEYGISSIYKCITVDGNTTIEKTPLPTCEVDVHHTFYRTDYSEKNSNGSAGGQLTVEGWGNQLSSCYFSLPENFSGYSNKYGFLDALTAEFYNYYTKPVLILDNETDYNNYYSQVGKNTNESLSFYTEFDSLDAGYGNYAGHFEYSYNCKPDGNTVQVNSSYKINNLSWVFPDYSGNDFGSEVYNFSGENLKSYFNRYASAYGRETAINDLFESKSYYDSAKLNLCGFDYGYNKHTYSISNNPLSEDDVFNFDLLFDDSSAIGRFFGIFNSDKKTVLPLELFDKSYLYKTDEDISAYYLIDINEVSSFKEFARKEISAGRDVWLFRYDACEYYGYEVEGLENGKGFLSTQSVYLDFDIISFRFDQNGEKFVIANVSSPNDVWNDITGDKVPKSDIDFLYKLITALQYVLYAITIITEVFLSLKLFKSIWNSDMHFAFKILLFVLIICIDLALSYLCFNYINKLIKYLRSLL